MKFSIVVICAANEGGCKIEVINGYSDKDVAEQQAGIIRSMNQLSYIPYVLVTARVIVSPDRPLT